MEFGYARSSTIEQSAGFEEQIRLLNAAGAHRIFAEQVSSVATRKELAAALQFLRPGDTLIVARLDRLARSVKELMAIVDTITESGASLRILDMNLDTTSPTGRLMLTVLGGVAEFERRIMLERQREGIAKAKAAGRYKGRKPTQWAKRDHIHRMLREGVRPADIARQLGMARSSVYRIARAES